MPARKLFANGGNAAGMTATALHANLTLVRVANMDLSYAPPYSPLWDSVAISARVVSEKLVEGG